MNDKSSDERPVAPRKNMAGWLTREMGAVQVVEMPRLTGGVVAWEPTDLTEAGRNLLRAYFAVQRLPYRAVQYEEVAVGCCVAIIGASNIKQLTELSPRTMEGVTAIWGEARGVLDGRWVGIALPHPDTLLMGERQSPRRVAAREGVRRLALYAAGELSVIDNLGVECVVCREKDATHSNQNVTELTRQGLGLCRSHSGWDVRPEGQRWQQEGLFK